MSKIVDGIVNSTMNTHIPVNPAFIVSVKLSKFGFKEGNIPTITNVKSRVDKIKCHSGVLRRYTADMDVDYYSKWNIMDLLIEFPYGDHAMYSLSHLKLKGTIRVELLMSTETGYPGLESASVSFLGRPRLDFIVKRNNIIGLDYLGVDKWVEHKVNELFVHEIVYPGAYYLDLSKLSNKEKIESFIIRKDPELHAAVLSAVVTVRPNTTHHARHLTATFHLEGQKTYIHDMSDNTIFQFDRFLDGFSSSSLKAKILLFEESVFSTAKYAEFIVDVPRLIKSDYLSKNRFFTYRDGKESWNINLNLSAYLLPKVPLVQQKKSVISLKTLYGLADCVSGGEKGVLYIHVHRAANLSVMDMSGSSDPYVIVYLDKMEIGRTDTIAKSTNPIFDKKFEVLLRNGDQLVSKQRLTFVVNDNDKMAIDDKMGSVSINATKNSRINEGFELNESGGSGVLYISTTFRPVPFLFV